MLLKLEKTLFYLFIFLIPFQIRIFLHNASNEWNSIFLYAGDMVLATMLILWILRGGLKEIFGVFGGATSENRRSHLLLLFFLLITFVSIFASSNSGISIYRFIKLLEFAL